MGDRRGEADDEGQDAAVVLAVQPATGFLTERRDDADHGRVAGVHHRLHPGRPGPLGDGEQPPRQQSAQPSVLPGVLHQERELDSMMGALVGLLGPLLIVVMGMFVMGIVFAMLMPIFEMNNLIR